TGTNRNEACGSTNFRMSQGQATRSTFTFSRVTHFMMFLLGITVVEVMPQGVFRPLVDSPQQSSSVACKGVAALSPSTSRALLLVSLCVSGEVVHAARNLGQRDRLDQGQWGRLWLSRVIVGHAGRVYKSGREEQKRPKW